MPTKLGAQAILGWRGRPQGRGGFTNVHILVILSLIIIMNLT